MRVLDSKPVASHGSVRANPSATFRTRLWQLAGIPVIGSKRSLRWMMVQEGMIRRSEDALSDEISSGISPEALDILLRRLKFSLGCVGMGAR